MSIVDTPEYQTAQRFLEITAELKELEPRVRELKRIRQAMQPALLAYLAAANMKAFPIGDYTLYPHREPWVYPIEGVSRQRVCEALKAAGLGRMVREDYSTGQLTSYVKQLEAHGQLIVGLEESNRLRELLHPALAEILRVQAAFSLHVRRKEKTFDLNDETPDQEEQGDDDE